MMEKYIEKALENHKKGYNCAQSVACAFCDVLELDEKLLFKLNEGFGAGMGNRKNTCGALSGAVMICGMKTSSGDPRDATKFETYKAVGEIADKFEERCHATVCGDIKNGQKGANPVSCNDCIRIATELAYEILLG